MHKIFESQLDNEKIYLVVREHPVLLLLRLLLILFLFAIGVAAQFLAPTVLAEAIGETGQAIISLVFNIYYLALLFGTLLVILFYYLSLQIITDMRMVDVDQRGLFKRMVTEIQIENVEEVSSKTHGFLATIFNYGHVLVQTSGSVAEFEFDNIAHPEQIKKLILDIYEQRKHLNPQSPKL